MFFRKKNNQEQTIHKKKKKITEEKIIYKLTNLIFSKSYFENIRWDFLIYETNPLENEIVCYLNYEPCIIGINEEGNLVALRFNFLKNENYLCNITIIDKLRFIFGEFSFDKNNNLISISSQDAILEKCDFDARGNVIRRSKYLFDPFYITPIKGRNKTLEELNKKVYLDYYSKSDDSSDEDDFYDE